MSKRVSGNYTPPGPAALSGPGSGSCAPQTGAYGSYYYWWYYAMPASNCHAPGTE